MELIRGIHNLKERHKGCVLSIGNFDGVHLGHQALLNKLKSEGQRLNAPIMVMIFEPQPLEYFSHEAAPARLTRLRDKVKHLAELGVDYLLCVEFNADFAAISAENFISQLLVDKLAVKFLVVGDDFHFGAERVGDISLLNALSHKYGFTVMNTDSFLCDDGKRISSTVIRQALANDNLLVAEKMLGRPYSISGRVIHGDALGRTIGFPTANIALKKVKSVIKGVYAVEVKEPGHLLRYGIANIGTRPTIAGVRQQLEVHLLDFDGDLYGHHIEVIFRKKLRSEQRFASLDALKQQIAADEQAARSFFTANN
jgi:riboflavin kinase/FMN adenylyltransferase